MKNIRRLLLKLFIFLFTFLFIFPAIFFSVLVLGLTDSWKSGTLMLISSLILIIIVNLNVMNKPSSRKKKEISLCNGERRMSFETQFNDHVPPPLSEIYRDIDYQHWEKDVLCGMTLERGSENNPYDYQCRQNCSEPTCGCCCQCLGLRGSRS